MMQSTLKYFVKYCVAWGLASLLGSTAAVGQNAARTDGPSQDRHFDVSTKLPWTDTGLDLVSGEVLQIKATGTACTGQTPTSSAARTLPLPSAPVGALLARLHSQGGEPLQVDTSKEIKIEEPGHLSLGVNGANCSGSYSVDVSIVPPGESAEAVPTKDLKSKLTTAAQIWLQGQFENSSTPTSANSSPAISEGSGAPISTTPSSKPADSFLVPSAPLDDQLRKQIDTLPRRVNDEFNNPGDMVNFVVVGTQEQVQAALAAGNWFVADTDNNEAAVKAVMQTIAKKDYLQMPMSKLMLFGRYQDYGYEQAEPIAMVASRHHFRLWKAAFTSNGQPVWVGAGTHDIGFERDQRNGKVTHKIDPAVDGERQNIAESFHKSAKAKSMTYYLPPAPVQEARNATGGGYHSDGRILVVFLN
jgi:LssY C-terminus